MSDELVRRRSQVIDVDADGDRLQSELQQALELANTHHEVVRLAASLPQESHAVIAQSKQQLRTVVELGTRLRERLLGVIVCETEVKAGVREFWAGLAALQDSASDMDLHQLRYHVHAITSLVELMAEWSPTHPNPFTYPCLPPKRVRRRLAPFIARSRGSFSRALGSLEPKGSHSSSLSPLLSLVERQCALCEVPGSAPRSPRALRHLATMPTSFRPNSRFSLASPPWTGKVHSRGPSQSVVALRGSEAVPPLAEVLTLIQALTTRALNSTSGALPAAETAASTSVIMATLVRSQQVDALRAMIKDASHIVAQARQAAELCYSWVDEATEALDSATRLSCLSRRRATVSATPSAPTNASAALTPKRSSRHGAVDQRVADQLAKVAEFPIESMLACLLSSEETLRACDLTSLTALKNSLRATVLNISAACSAFSRALHEVVALERTVQDLGGRRRSGAQLLHPEQQQQQQQQRADSAVPHAVAIHAGVEWEETVGEWADGALGDAGLVVQALNKAVALLEQGAKWEALEAAASELDALVQCVHVPAHVLAVLGEENNGGEHEGEDGEEAGEEKGGAKGEGEEGEGQGKGEGGEGGRAAGLAVQREGLSRGGSGGAGRLPSESEEEAEQGGGGDGGGDAGSGGGKGEQRKVSAISLVVFSLCRLRRSVDGLPAGARTGTPTQELLAQITAANGLSGVVGELVDALQHREALRARVRAGLARGVGEEAEGVGVEAEGVEALRCCLRKVAGMLRAVARDHKACRASNQDDSDEDSGDDAGRPRVPVEEVEQPRSPATPGEGWHGGEEEEEQGEQPQQDDSGGGDGEGDGDGNNGGEQGQEDGVVAGAQGSPGEIAS